MSRPLYALVFCGCVLAGQLAAGQPNSGTPAGEEIRQRLTEYLNAFNSNNADKVASFWAANAVSVNEETGERIVGRKALHDDFHAFFERSTGAKLTGQPSHIRLIKPDVAVVDGQATLFLADSEPAKSSFTAILIKENGAWVLESSQERPLPSPPTTSDALQELSWLVGQWRDQTAEAEVVTTVRWSPSNAFLIRSYFANFPDGESFEGTQIIGWDPQGKQFRTWSFNSDGSFGEGVVSRNGAEWLEKSTQTQSDGRLATETKVMTRVDDNTLTVEKIGRTVGGSPLPSSGPITIQRVSGSQASSAAEGDAS